MDFPERIDEFLHDIRMNASQLSEHLGYTGHARISRLRKKNNKNLSNKPSFEVICDLLNKYTTLNARWILLGEGEMWLDNINAKNIISVGGKKSIYTGTSCTNLAHETNGNILTVMRYAGIKKYETANIYIHAAKEYY